MQANTVLIGSYEIMLILEHLWTVIRNTAMTMKRNLLLIFVIPSTSSYSVCTVESKTYEYKMMAP